MKGALQIARVFDIPVRIHWTFLLLFGWIFLAGQSRSGNWQFMAWSTAFVLTIFFCVVLHEFGHALTARRFGVTTRDIILSPIGGIARLDKLPEKPWQEFLVAIAGPLVNVGIAILLLPLILLLYAEELLQLWTMITGGPQPESNGKFSTFGFYLPSIFLLNLTLATFNMLPAFPMDGGRIFRALLSIRLGRIKATRIASIIGQILAVLLALYGFWEFSIITVFIAVFVYFTAAQEYQFVKMDNILRSHRVLELMQTGFSRISPNDTLQHAFEELQKGKEHNFLVLEEEEHVLGILQGPQITEALKKQELHLPVVEYILPNKDFVKPEDSLKTAYEKMQKAEQRILPVMKEGKLLAALEVQALNNFIKLRQNVMS